MNLGDRPGTMKKKRPGMSSMALAAEVNGCGPEYDRALGRSER